MLPAGICVNPASLLHRIAVTSQQASSNLVYLSIYDSMHYLFMSYKIIIHFSYHYK